MYFKIASFSIRFHSYRKEFAPVRANSFLEVWNPFRRKRNKQKFLFFPFKTDRKKKVGKSVQFFFGKEAGGIY